MNFSSRSIRSAVFVFFAAVTLCCSVGTLAFAATKIKTFKSTGFNGKPILCAAIARGTFVSAARVSGTHVTTKLTVAEARVRTAKTKKQKLAAEALVRLAKQDDKICKPGKPAATPTPTPTATPVLADNLSLAPYQGEVTSDLIRNFFDKAGFGIGAKEADLVNTFYAQGIEAGVQAFMSQRAESADFDPAWLDQLDTLVGTPNTEFNYNVVTARGERLSLLYRLINTNNPWRYSMTEFLRRLYVADATTGGDTKKNALWQQYYELLFSHAFAGDIEQTLNDVTQNPNMLFYLSNANNVAGTPNENYARELMQLFSIGPTRTLPDGTQVANYTEQVNGDESLSDIRMVANVLTGYTMILLNDSQGVPQWTSAYVSAYHQPGGPFTLFAGTSFAFTANDVPTLIHGLLYQHPSASQFYAKRVLQYFLTPNPPQALIDQMSQLIVANQFHLATPLKTLFLSKAFQDVSYRSTLPVDSLMHTVRFARQMGMEKATNLSATMDELEKTEVANMPPTVFWWPDSTWDTPSVLPEMSNQVGRFLNDTTSQTNAGWTLLSILPPGTPNSVEVVQSLATRLGVTYDAGLQAIIDPYMNNKLSGTKLVAQPFDVTKSAIVNDKVKGAIQMLEALDLAHRR